MRKVTATYRQEWQGVILAACDPRAWENTMFAQRFPNGPTRKQVIEHLRDNARMNARIKELHPFYERECKVPILWDFGKVYWESTDSLMVVKNE